MKLEWVKQSYGLGYDAETPHGTYSVIRTVIDVAVLYFRGKEIRRSASDLAFSPSMKYAQKHYDAFLEKEYSNER